MKDWQKKIEKIRGEKIEEIDSSLSNFEEISSVADICVSPKVSVLMLTYNHEKYISKAISSIVNQECDFEYEILIGEDFSTDETYEICKRYQKLHPDKVRIIHSLMNCGSSANSFRLKFLARGEYFAVCEGDDFWNDRKKLSLQVDIMEKNPSVYLCASNANILYDTGVVVQEKNKILKNGIITKKVFSEILENYGSVIRTVTVLYRKIDYGLLLEKYEILKYKWNMGDYLWWLLLSNEGDVYFFEDNLATYRYGQQGITHSSRKYDVDIDASIVLLYFKTILNNKPLLLSPQMLGVFIRKLSKTARFKTKRVRSVLLFVCQNFYFLFFWHPANLLALILAFVGVGETSQIFSVIFKRKKIFFSIKQKIKNLFDQYLFCDNR